VSCFNGNVVMHYPTICAYFNFSLPNNSVAPLTINESSHIMTIIKLNNMTYHYQPPQQKQNMTFLHSGRVWVWVRGGYIYPYFPSRTRILKSGKTRQIGVGLGGYPWARVLLPCLTKLPVLVWQRARNKVDKLMVHASESFWIHYSKIYLYIDSAHQILAIRLVLLIRDQ